MGAGLSSWFYLLIKKIDALQFGHLTGCSTLVPVQFGHRNGCPYYALRNTCAQLWGTSPYRFFIFTSADLTYVLVGLLAKAAKFAAKASQQIFQIDIALTCAYPCTEVSEPDHGETLSLCCQTAVCLKCFAIVFCLAPCLEVDQVRNGRPGPISKGRPWPKVDQGDQGQD